MRNPYRFDAHRWKERYADYVRGAFGLSLGGGPLFAFVARLVHQKGIDLVLEASEAIVARGGQIVIVGRGEPEYERAAVELARRHPHAVGARIGYDADEARSVFAGADFLLMPSRYEPCGLSQMYAQRFGALPIGHRTGGLAETIEPGRTGFLFDRLDIAAFEDAIGDACAVFETSPALQAMRRAAMAKDFSWADSAAAYATLYRQLGEARARRGCARSGDCRRCARRPGAPRRAPSSTARSPPSTRGRCSASPPPPRRRSADARRAAETPSRSLRPDCDERFAASFRKLAGAPVAAPMRRGAKLATSSVGEAARGAAGHDGAAGARRRSFTSRC